MTLSGIRSPTSTAGRPGTVMRAYVPRSSCSASAEASTGLFSRTSASTMPSSRSASDPIRSWALLVMVRVSTMTRETPNTAITTSTTASVELIRRRRMA